jgi:hypothetical protein
MKPLITPWRLLRWLLPVFLCMTISVSAQEDKPFKQEQLDQMLAPIALYPDALLSQVLMASTYPADVADAAKWSAANPGQQGDEAVKAVENQSWDPSVKSLVAFPQVLATMAEKPEWVQSLGDAFLAQPDEVMDAVQRLRAAAKKEGNLETTAEQTVTEEKVPPSDQNVVIVQPTNPQVLYVPVYNPTVVYGTWWYPMYPPYYWPPPPRYAVHSAFVSGIAFGIGVGFTYALWGGCDWGRHDVNINVNRYNNINVNNRIDINRNRVDWKHNPEHRRGVPYRDANSREKYDHRVSGADKRRDFRGRDPQREASRERAQAELQKRGLDPGQGRDQLLRDSRTREQARATAREIDRDGTATRDMGRDRTTARDFDQDRSRQMGTGRSRDNALSGVNNAPATRQQVNRGNASRQSMQRHTGARGGGGWRR